LKFSDYVAQGEMFVDWKPFNHPVYGEIEIGGWVKMSSRLPQLFMLPELVHRNAAVVLLAAENTPEISMEVFEVKKYCQQPQPGSGKTEKQKWSAFNDSRRFQ
jgi:hypothetical protein